VVDWAGGKGVDVLDGVISDVCWQAERTNAADNNSANRVLTFDPVTTYLLSDSAETIIGSSIVPVKSVPSGKITLTRELSL